MKVSKEYLKFHEYNLEGSVENKLRWFKNSIGALDGIHIPVTVSAEDRPRYSNRKGDIFTNVFGVCGPDLRFIYVLPGWEGSVGDSRVLRDVLHRQNCLHIPNGKYFLVDAGYTNGPGFLAPYRGTRHHLNEWIGITPQNYKELFNLRHASARNVIERSFGVLKKRWSILRTLSFFDIKTQIRIINACFMLHNFIRDEQHSDPILEAQDLELLSVVDNELINQQMERVTNNIGDEVTTIQATEEWTRFCDTLAMNIEMESSNVKNKSSGKRKMSSEDTRSYFAWNLEMERVLADVLRDQTNLGNKGDGNWKAVAYSTAAQILSKRFGVHLMADNYGIVSDILSQSGFDWDSTKYMITVENEIAWNEYVKSHEEAKRFRFKVIPNWDDIVDLCAKDRATGLGAENALDADDIMSKETNEEEAIHSVSFDLEGSSSITRKNIRPSKSGEKEGMISSMKEVAKSLKEFVEVTKKKMENKKKMEIKEAQEVVHEVKICEGIPVLKQMQLENSELFWKLDLFCD
ncbi:Protein ALP1-like [Glycine max]|nr:Protein ALP1-like [Glycine max]